MRRINQSQADIKPFHFRSPERWHWSPGQPIPKDCDPDPWAALSLAELRRRTPIEPCLCCGRLLVLAAHSLTIRCAEGRVETAYICYRCSPTRSVSSSPEVQAA